MGYNWGTHENYLDCVDIDTGTVDWSWHSGYTTYIVDHYNNPLIDNDALPFGGWKMSGVGRELSRLGLDLFRRSKMVIIDHKPVIHEWWYPYPDAWFYDAGGRQRS